MLVTNLLEPWVLFRLAAGLVATALFVRGAFTAQKVLRRFDVRRATEGQLALEKQLELAATFARVAAVVQVLALVLAVLGADRLSRGVRGAMCAYGVFGANEWGFRSLVATTAIAVVAGVVAEVFAFDARVRTLDSARPLSLVLLAMAGFAAIDLVLATRFLLGLDLTVVASCCSVQLDPVASSGATFAGGPRLLATALAAAGVAVSIAVALIAARSPSRRNVIFAGAASLVTMPAAVVTAVLEVAPHAFETPHHVCPFCLLKAEVLGVGYPLFGAIYVATVSAVAAAASAVLSSDARALAPFAKSRMRRGIAAWAVAVAVAAIPIGRYAIASGGASLFAAGGP
jgi:hypothetical protein